MSADILKHYLTEITTFVAPALGASILFSSLTYMFGKTTNNERFIVLAKENLGEVIFSALIIALIPIIYASLSTIAFSLSSPLTHAYGQDHIELAIINAKILRNKLINIYTELYVYEFNIALGSTLGFGPPLKAIALLMRMFDLTIPTISVHPLAGFAPIAEAQGMIVEIVGYFISISIARILLLQFIRNYGVLFLALGLALRSFIFTKRTGTGLIALSLVAIFVYPLATMLTHYLIFYAYQPEQIAFKPTLFSLCVSPQGSAKMMEEYKGNVNTFKANMESIDPISIILDVLKEIGKTLISAIYDWFFAFTETLGKVFKNIVNPLFGLPTTPWKVVWKQWLEKFFDSPLLFGAFYDLLLAKLRVMMELPATFLFSSVIEIMITISAYRSIALALDAELDIFGITKLV
jgi:hypothetical protein